MGKGWKRRYTVAIVVLAAAIAVAVFLPSSELPINCVYILRRRYECPVLDHHVALRLLIGFGGVAIAATVAFIPLGRKQRLTPFSN